MIRLYRTQLAIVCPLRARLFIPCGNHRQILVSCWVTARGLPNTVYPYCFSTRSLALVCLGLNLSDFVVSYLCNWRLHAVFPRQKKLAPYIYILHLNGNDIHSKLLLISLFDLKRGIFVT